MQHLGAQHCFNTMHVTSERCNKVAVAHENYESSLLWGVNACYANIDLKQILNAIWLANIWHFI